MSRAKRGGWRSWWMVVTAMALAAVCGLGCRGILGHSSIPEDPLFAKRKPVESKAITAAPVAIAFVEPPLPRDFESAPALAADSKRDKSRAIPRSTTDVPGILTSQPGARRAPAHKRSQENDKSNAEGPVLPPTMPR